MEEKPKREYKRSIRAKLIWLVLVVSALALLMCAGIAFWGLQKMQTDARAIGSVLGQTAADGSEEALIGEAKQSLQSMAKERADLAGEKLGKIAGRVSLAAAYMRDVYDSPEMYVPRQVERPRMENAGKWVLQYLLSDGVRYADVKDEINQTGALFSIAAPLGRGNDSVDSIYFVSESGFMIFYDRNAGDLEDKKKSGDAEDVRFEGYDPRIRDGYKAALAHKTASFTKPYIDPFGRFLITCAMPVYGKDGRARGVVAMDIQIEDIKRDIIAEAVGDEDGYAFILDRDGAVMMSPNLSLEKDGNYRESNLKSDPETAALAEQMTGGDSGIMLCSVNGEEGFVAYAPIQHTDWSIGLALHKHEIIAPAQETYEQILWQTGKAVSEIDDTVRIVFWCFLLGVVVVAAIVYKTASLLSRRISDPVLQLAEDAREISRGNLAHRVEVETGDELESLGAAFNHMTASLSEYMENLANVRADRERIQTELNVARTIQSSMLPGIFPPFPERPEFDIFAGMFPAKEVGGDFYDFFFTDDDHVWVVMADVSGKGVPAALFMVIAKTMLKNHAGFTHSPAEVLTVVNEKLCENNDAEMFVTVFIGVLELSTGRFVFANAGHNSPLLCRAGESYEWLKGARSLVLAGMEGICYKDVSLVLRMGDRLLLYTDGVTEALNPSEELYGDARLQEVANRMERALPIRHGVEAVKRSVTEFADGAEQADDITILLLEVRKMDERREGRSCRK